MLNNSLQATLVILILLFVGWFMSWKKWMLREHKSFVVKLIVNISIPSMVIINFFESFSREMLFASTKLLLAPLITILISHLIAIGLSVVFKIDKGRRGSFITMCSVSNSMFIGLPVCQELFGDISIPYVMIYYIVNTIVFWTLCNPRIRADGEGKSGSIRESIKKIVNPPLVTVVISSILLIIGYKPPLIVLKTTKYLGSMVTPLALILAGKIIHETGLKNIKLDFSIGMVMVMRFIIAPLIAFSVSRGMGIENMAIQVFTIQASMPVMVLVAVSAEAYKADSAYVASAVSITTIASLVFIPIYMSIMQMLL